MKSDALSKDIHFIVGILSLYLLIPESHSLKEKRSVVKPLMHRIQRDFNISIAEIGFQDQWQECFLVCSTVSNNAAYTQTILQNILNKIDKEFFQVQVINHKIEIL